MISNILHVINDWAFVIFMVIVVVNLYLFDKKLSLLEMRTKLLGIAICYEFKCNSFKRENSKDEAK